MIKFNMKIRNKEIWVILISAIIMASVLGYTVKAANRTVTVAMNFKDILITKDQYQKLGAETFSTDFLLPSENCDNPEYTFVNYCSYVYKQGIDGRADINKDGKIDSNDLLVMKKAFDCNKNQTCWSRPVEDCFFTISGRKFKDPTRDCKITIDDLNLIQNNFGKNDTNALSGACENDDICKSDVDQDGDVDIYDVTILSPRIGQTADSFERLVERASYLDLNGNNVIDLFDIMPIAINYGADAIEQRCSKTSVTHVSGRLYRLNIAGVGISSVMVIAQCAV